MKSTMLKNSLLAGTTMAAFALVAVQAKAQVTVNAIMALGFAVGSIDYSDATKADQNTQGVVSNSEIHVKAEKDVAVGKAGVKVEFEVNADGANDYLNTTGAASIDALPTTGNGEIDESSVYLSGNWGRVELGNMDGAEDDRLHGYDDNLAGMTLWNAAAVSFTNAVVQPNAVFDGEGNALIAYDGITSAGTTNSADTADVAKMLYTTPSFSGVKLSVSYAPNVSDSTAVGGVRVDQQIGSSLGYDGKLGTVDVSARANYASANVTNTTFEGTADLYGAGASVKYNNLKLLGGYYVGNTADSATTEDVNKNLSFGFNYEFLPFKIYGSWTQNKWDDGTDTDAATTTENSLGAFMALGQGVILVVSGIDGKLDHSTNTKDIDYNSLAMGIVASF